MATTYDSFRRVQVSLKRWGAVWLLLGFMAGFSSARAAAPTRWVYQLLPESVLIDDCPPCARPTIPQPMQGTFVLRAVEENPLFARYAIESLAFTAGGVGGKVYKVTGRGDYRIGGEVALVQDLNLELTIDDGTTTRLVYCTNATPRVERWWPVLEATVVQTNGTFTQVYQLTLRAAPFREIWFSTQSGLTPGNVDPPTNRVSGGALLSSLGHVVKTNRELTARLGWMPSLVPLDFGLDAVDVRPGGEIVFSLERDAFSETLGTLAEGDLLSSQGKIVRRNQALTAAFGQMPPAADQGLDAVQVRDDGEILFSVRRDFFSERLGRRVRTGDLLSSAGTIVKSNEQLVAGFAPIDPRQDFGLDAVFVWPSGEIWFSTERGIVGRSGTYGHGDLLSDQGYLVARNLDLVAAFQPLEDLADFGLDALCVVTDVRAGEPPPEITRVLRRGGATELEWKGTGRFFQIERAQTVTGPYLPVGAIVPDLSFTDREPAAGRNGFYRVRQW